MTEPPASSGRPAPPSAEQLRATFDAPAPLTVGLEEELMLLDPDSLGLVHRALELLERVKGDARFTHEFPASQLEILTAPATRVGDAIGQSAGPRWSG